MSDETSIEVAEGQPATITKTIKLPMNLRPSSALPIMSSALAQVEEVLVKAEQSLQLLQQNLAQVTNQRIALISQKQLLTELIATIKKSDGIE